jgi:hypothetical protein
MQKNTRAYGAGTAALLALANFAGVYAVYPAVEDFDLRLSLLESRLNLPADIPEKGHYFAFAEVLAWHTYENGFPVAIETKNPLVVFPPIEAIQTNYASLLKGGKVKNLDFEWDPGFRTGIGYRWSHNWELGLTWLRFFTTAHRHLHAGSGKQLQAVQLAAVDGFGSLADETIAVAGAATSPFFSKADAHWYAHLNQLDFDLTRPFHVGKRLSLTPQFGLRTTWLQQRLSVDYKDDLVITSTAPLTTGNDYNVRKKVNWWGIGPEAGVGIGFDFKGGWSIVGRAAGAIEYGFHVVKEKDIDATLAKAGASSVLIDARNLFRMSHPIFDLQLGLMWDRSFGTHGTHLCLEGGWEQHVYFSQNQMPYYYNAALPAEFISDQGDLVYQGWRFAVQVDF